MPPEHLILRDQMIFVEGLNQRLDRHAPSILLLHGAGMDHRVWSGQIAGLRRRGLQVLAPDLPGHGVSEGAALATIPEMADWVAELLEALGLAEVFVAGHSMGALVALDLAARYGGGAGTRIGGLALFGCAAEMPVNDALLEAAEEDLPKAATMIGKWGLAKRAQTKDRKKAGEAESIEGGAAAACRDILLASRPGVLRSDLAACALYREGAASAAAVTFPVLVVAGAEDRMTPAKAGRALAEGLRQGRLLVIPEAGHMMMLESPAETLRALADLVDEVERRGKE